jgi:hypothetical protein
MSESPIRQTMDGILEKLKEAIKTRAEAEKEIAEYTNALRALAKVIEDKEAGDQYLASLDELSGKFGFADAIRFVLGPAQKPLTTTAIRSLIQISKKMDLSAYSNPMASIHTTLRRMVESGEVEVVIIDGEKAYRTRPMGPNERNLRAITEEHRKGRRIL